MRKLMHFLNAQHLLYCLASFKMLRRKGERPALPGAQAPSATGPAPGTRNHFLSENTTSDEFWMEEAMRCAQRALEADEVPVGAVVVAGGVVIGSGWNRSVSESDPAGHAEIMALREAGRKMGNYRLGGCELFVTIEPCAMCAGAAIHARLQRLVYGAEDAKAGAVQSVLQVLNHPGLNHRMEVRGGVLGGRSANLLQEFFRNRR